MSPNLEKLLPTLVGAGVEFVIIGGVAGILHGSARAFTVRFKCIDLPTLIRIKEAAGRRKDLEAIAELRVLLEEIEKSKLRRAQVFSATRAC